MNGIAVTVFFSMCKVQGSNFGPCGTHILVSALCRNDGSGCAFQTRLNVRQRVIRNLLEELTDREVLLIAEATELVHLDGRRGGAVLHRGAVLGPGLQEAE